MGNVVDFSQMCIHAADGGVSKSENPPGRTLKRCCGDGTELRPGPELLNPARGSDSVVLAKPRRAKSVESSCEMRGG